MSGKRARSFRKKSFPPKKVLALCAGLCLFCVPATAENEFLLSLFAPITKPLGETHYMQNGFGGGLKLTYRPVEFVNIFAQGEYLYMTMPYGVDPITIWDGAVGAGYHLIISDRCAVDVSASGGLYAAQLADNSTSGFTAGVSVGFSYNVSPVVSVDVSASGTHYASTPKPLMTVNTAITPGITVNITELFNNTTNIDMQLNELAPVFPALYSWYETNPFGKVTITNNEDTAITDVTVSFYQPQYMAHAKECGTIRKIEKGESVEFDLLAFFNEQMLELTEMTETNSLVMVNYLCLGQKRTKTFALDVPVYGRNNMSWDDDRRAAVFVSSKDPAAMRFAKYVTSIVREKKRSAVPVNIQYAMGIFETLNQFGINYVIDPSSAFEDNVGTASIDFLQFPYQTLMFKGGDCDDLSILVCSLFEAVGIKTAFITIPGHIFMAFDSGLTVQEGTEKLQTLSNYIEIEDELWVPLEITLSDEGFNKAYRYGAREWNKAYSEGTSAIYRMQDSWQTYPPISVPGATEKFTMPTKKQITSSFEKSIEQWTSSEIKKVEKRQSRVASSTEDVKTKTDKANSKNNKGKRGSKVEDPSSVAALYEVLALSGQEIAINTISDINHEGQNKNLNEYSIIASKLESLKSDDEDEDDFDEDVDESGLILPPVIAVNVPGPEVLGIIVPGREARVVTDSKDNKPIVAKTLVKVVSEKTLPDRILPEKTTSVPAISEQKNTIPEKMLPVEKSGILTDNQKTDTTSTKKIEPVTTKKTEPVTTKKIDTPKNPSMETAASTAKNETSKPKSKHIIVLSIIALTLILNAAIGVFISRKKKGN